MSQNPDDLPTEGKEGGDASGPVATRIEAKLTAAFRPLELEITNQSHLHEGHAGAPAHDDPDRAESHFKVRIVAELFEGMSRIERQRQVNEALAEELAGPVHMLSMETVAPREA